MSTSSYNGKTCVVTGANGFVGSHLVDALAKAGANVKALVRQTSDLSLLEGVESTLVYGDVSERDSLEAAFDGADYVFHVAGVVKALNNDTFDTVNRGGCENVCEAILTSAPKLERLVLVSSLAAGGPTTRGHARTEDEPDEPVSIYGHSKLAGEKLTLEYADRIPLTVGRPPFVYGPGDSASFEIFAALKKHFKVIITGGPRLYSFVYVRDLCDCLMVLGSHERAVNEVFYTCSSEVLSYKELQDEVQRHLGTWAIYTPMPAFLMPMAGNIADWMARRKGKAAVFSRQKVAEALPEAWVCSPEKAKRLLGFETKMEIPEGFRIQTEWYREHGWI
ncbi:MAG: NAD-dependent epimerase/dehydratase family protein [Myxococcales bacterium]|nr:NAD-dependent epimerase/dehydratase family protein [Myxococcales bacterium]